ncbi:MAG: glyoxalase/bleomycin resistance/extradiol dioxygenase family protein [Bacteroidia bacterium]
MKLNLLVIRTSDPKKLKKQYELLGFTFSYHQHGKGSFHYSAENDGLVFEIYPLTKSMEKADNSVRLGFEIKNLDLKIQELENSNWKIESGMSDTEWGQIAVVQDLDGRKIELKNK